jgi:hypothetical protein
VNVPFVIRVRVIWSRAGDQWYGVSKLSKLLNQESALSAPCLRGNSCSPQSASRSEGMAVEVTFDVTLPLAISESSFGEALMLSRWLAADARAERASARPSRAVVARRR